MKNRKLRNLRELFMSQVLHSMVLPSSESRLDRSRSFQLACVKKAPLLVQCLSDKDFLHGAAPHTRRYILFSVNICK